MNDQADFYKRFENAARFNHRSGSNFSPVSPRVSIGIPVYTAARTLPATLRSVFAQTVSDWELILVDDGSTDDSLAIMQSIRDPRVRVYADGEQRTLAPRLNQIARLARAPFLARMDADDLMHPTRLEAQLAFLSAHPEVDVVGSSAYSIDGGYRIQGRRISSPAEMSDFSVGLRGAMMHMTALGKTAWFLANPYDESPHAARCEDAELWFRTWRYSRFHVLAQPLVFYMEDTTHVVQKLRTSNLCKLRMMFLGNSPVRKKPLRLRLAIAGVIGAKMTVYELCALVGRADYLVKRRNRPLDASELAEAQAVLEHVLSVPVPGLG